MVLVSKHFFHYAIAMYLKQSNDQIQRHYHLNQQALDALRQELSELIFAGEKYEVKDIVALTKSSGWQSGKNSDNLSNYYGQNSRY
ncbi:DUF6559 family protein [Photobacterium minamisatsumaniensis]|uniref:DUF6559 family protein n=1 Tax=Photobacterium minamisatsumaniensis TaxID=2910233 RepID=UPI003D0E18B8